MLRCQRAVPTRSIWVRWDMRLRQGVSFRTVARTEPPPGNDPIESRLKPTHWLMVSWVLAPLPHPLPNQCDGALVVSACSNHPTRVRLGSVSGHGERIGGAICALPRAHACAAAVAPMCRFSSSLLMSTPKRVAPCPSPTSCISHPPPAASPVLHQLQVLAVTLSGGRLTLTGAHSRSPHSPPWGC
jgi:hypothetical protein